MSLRIVNPQPDTAAPTAVTGHLLPAADTSAPAPTAPAALPAPVSSRPVVQLTAGSTLILAAGGTGVVRQLPRVFATLTAPSFGPVHNRPASGRCRCGVEHQEHDPELGSALDPDAYDYAGAGAALWNNHAGHLWRYVTISLPREIARRIGCTLTDLKQRLRVSYGKVAEYQKRGLIHFHTVIRLDGPQGPDTTPPAWATHDLLEDALRAAAARAEVELPPTPGQPPRTLTWGTQLDVRPIAAFADGQELTEAAVASYVAKYATKAAESTGTVDHRIGPQADGVARAPRPVQLIKAPSSSRDHAPQAGTDPAP